MPFAVSCLQALRPSSHIGSFITIFLCIAARGRASSTILSASSEITSAETGPSTISVISFTTCLKSFAIREGFVVTPQIMPISLARLMSSTLAVSIKSFIGTPSRLTGLSIIFLRITATHKSRIPLLTIIQIIHQVKPARQSLPS